MSNPLNYTDTPTHKHVYSSSAKLSKQQRNTVQF